MLLFVSQHIVTTVDRVKNRELTERTIRERTRQLRQINDDLQEEILERQKVEALQPERHRHPAIQKQRLLLICLQQAQALGENNMERSLARSMVV